MNATNWQPDGWDARTRIGVLVPHADVGPESELQAMAPQGVRIYGARVLFTAMGSGGVMDPTIPHAPVRAFAEPPHIDEAAELIAAAPVNAIAIGFTSTGYVLGADGERRLVERLMAHTRGIPVVSTCASIVEGLRKLGATRIAMFDPPWFDDELTRLGRDHYTSQGLDVVHAASCDLASAQSAIRPPDVYEWIRAHTPDTADAVIVGGNGFRAIGSDRRARAGALPPAAHRQPSIVLGRSSCRGRRRNRERVRAPVRHATLTALVSRPSR